jgi:hypothetical protein
MREHQLKNAPGITITYSFVAPAQKQTFNQEGLEMEISIQDIHILGRRVSDNKFSELLKSNNGVWTAEILDSIKRGENGRSI